MARRVGWMLIAMTLLLAACGGGAGSAADSAGMAAEEAEAGGAATGGDATSTAEEGVAIGLADSDAARTQPAGDEEGAQAPEVQKLAPLDAAAFDDKIIREGTVTVEVAEGAFDRGLLRVSEIAQELGGTVVSMNTQQDQDESPSGSVTVRVPTDEYDALISGIGGIGKVRGRKISSRDVTTEYVDLRSRLRHAEAQERFYLGLLSDAKDVQDAIAVQQQLNGIQTEIERMRGRLRFLDARTAYSTLTVAIFEPGAPAVVTREPSTGPSLARYWETAQEAFVTVVGSVMVTVVSLLPLLVLLALAFAAWRMLRARAGTPAAPEPVE